MASEYLKRSLIPRLVIATGGVDWPHRLGAILRRGLGLHGKIELYFAFDDPYSAIALPQLIEIATRREQSLVLYPLIERGIDGDPALEQRRRHAVTDSHWLARRDGRRLSRMTSLQPRDCEFLAAWTESARGSPGMAAFAAAALQRIWFQSSGPLKTEDFHSIFYRYLQREPPPDVDSLLPRLRANHERLLRKGHWESPAARVAGQWFFAHERIPQIEARLSVMGYTES